MTKTMTDKLTPTRTTGGFTLIEMLVVAALIAIFAGLAVFNIVEQLNREKEKAAIAEARSIATAMSFAHDDLGFFPKLCFLRFSSIELSELIGNPLPNDAIDWFDRGGTTMKNVIQNKWGEKYMAGSMPEKYIKMTVNFRSGGTQDFKWPCDPFNQPYMAYLLKIEKNPNDPTAEPVIGWADDSLGDSPNYFAGIISYGRNKVPGYPWNDPNAFTDGQNLRLFAGPIANDQRHFSTSQAVYQDPARLQWFLQSEPNPELVEPFDRPPHPRDPGSDDKYFEF